MRGEGSDLRMGALKGLITTLGLAFLFNQKRVHLPITRFLVEACNDKALRAEEGQA